MTAIAQLHQAALDAAIWASAPPATIATHMADELEGLLGAEAFTSHQANELSGLLQALRLLADRVEGI